MARVGPVLVPLLLLASCNPPENPAERYLRFAEAARTGRSAQVWAMLSARSRQGLKERARALAGEKSPPGVAIEGSDLVLGGLAPTAPRVKSVTVLRESSDAAVLSVEEVGGLKGEVSLVREGGDWRVELPGG